jgi:WD40 repeat protein
MTYRIFLSSPGDVDPERDAAERVVARINAEHAGSPPFELVRWEHSFYTAAQTFQAQIRKPSDCDLVACIFWKRLGSDLPEQYRRADGSLPTGTEFEFEDALERATTDANKVPDILVYRKTDPVLFQEQTAALEIAQRDRFLSFWNKWFRNEQGHFVAAFHSFLGSAQFASLFESHLRQWLTSHRQGASWTRGSPFRGLEAFDVEHAPIYFGRRYDVERARARLMTNALAGTAFLLVTGPSGAGKSSLARAGLIPRLVQPGALGEIAGTAQWLILSPDVLKPESENGWGAKLATEFFADERLGKALSAGDFDTPEKLARLMERGGAEAAMPLARGLKRLGNSSHHALVVLVDSLEQIFQWDPSQAASFATFLKAMAEARGILVIATIRSDYLHRIPEIPPLAELCATKEVRGPGDADRVLDIGFPSPSDLREMILGPAKAAGLAYEWDAASQTDLGKQLEADAEPESLPVLSFLMKELYEKRAGDLLTWKAYWEIGGLEGALSLRGEAALADKDLAAAFPYLVRRLVAFGGHPPQAYAVQVDEASLASEPAQHRLAKALVDAGLLVAAERKLRLAHDQLLLKWKRLADQVGDDRRNLEARERLGQLFQRFKQVEGTEPKNATRYYLEGFPLEEGRNLLADWGEVTIDGQSPGLAGFITQSVRRHKARSRRNIGLALLLCSVLSALLISSWWFARQRSEAELLAEVRLNLTRVEAAMRTGDQDRAVGLAIRANALADNEDTRSALLSALIEQSPHLNAIVTLPGALALWIDAKQFLLIGANGEARLLTPSGTKELAALKVALVDSPAIAGIPDGEGGFLLAQANGGIVHAKADLTLDKVPGIDLNAHFAHQASLHIKDGTMRLAIADGYSGAMLRTCTTQGLRDCKDIDLGKRGTAAAITPDGTTLALSETGETGAQLWVYTLGADDIPSSAQALLPLEADATSLDWSSDGRWLALGRRDGRLQLLDMTTRQSTVAWTPETSAYPVVSLSWSPSGNALVFNCGNAQLCLVDGPDAAKAQKITLMSGSKGTVKDLAWNPEGTGFASIHGQSELRYWLRTPKDSVLTLLPVSAQSGLVALASDRDRRKLASGDERGTLWITDLSMAQPQTQALGTGDLGAIASLAYAADGALATGYANGQVALQTSATGDPLRVERLGDNLRRLAWTGDGQAIVAPLANGDLAVLPRSGALRVLKSPEGAARADGITSASPDQVITSHRDGSLRSWSLVSGEQRTLYDQAEVADPGSALSLAIDGSGRWIAATRLDDQLKLYDLKHERAPIAVPLRNRDTKVVAFSPANTKLAALGSDGMLYVWQFDPTNGALAPLASVFPVPSGIDRKGSSFGRRAAAWLTWVDDASIAIAASSGDIVLVTVSPEKWPERLRQLDRIDKFESLLE